VSDKFKITLKIAGKTYPNIEILRQKEELYRRAEKELNAVVDMYRGSFRAEDDEYLAMAALQMALQCVELEMKGNADSEQARLEQIEAQIDAYLKEI
jgi:cell division protein ZapA